MQTPDHSQLQDIVRRVLLPAVIGGAGGGALSAYTASKANPQGETPEMRRKRILKNALVGAALGGGAGAAIPTGWHMLTQPYFGAPPPARVDQKAMNFLAGNAGTALAGGAAVGGLKALQRRDRDVAMKHLLGVTGGMKGMDNEAKLRAFLGASQGNRNALVNRLAAAKGLGSVDAHKARMGWNDVLSQAGFKGMSLEDMASPKGVLPRPAWHTSPAGANVVQALKDRLMEATPEFLGPLRRFTPTGIMSQLAGKELGGVSFTPAARWYAEDFLRPATKALGSGRMGWGPRLGIAGAGVLGAKSIWDSVTGN